jgi:hypothetical protein
MHHFPRCLIFAGLALSMLTPALFAVIGSPMPMQKIIRDSQYIIVAKVEKVFPDKPAMMLTVEEDLKGKYGHRKLPVWLKGDQEAKELGHIPQLMKRLTADLPIILFLEEKLDKNEKKLSALAYSNGTWMHFIGDRTGADTVVWSLTHGEPYLRRTYKGPTEELKKVLVDVLASKKRAPDIDPKESPGFGPEVK